MANVFIVWAIKSLLLTLVLFSLDQGKSMKNQFVFEKKKLMGGTIPSQTAKLGAHFDNIHSLHSVSTLQRRQEQDFSLV